MSKGHVAQKQTLECSNFDDESGNAGTTTRRHEALALVKKLNKRANLWADMDRKSEGEFKGLARYLWQF